LAFGSHTAITYMAKSISAGIRDAKHRWVTPGLDGAQAEKLTRQNLASLDRKISYCATRPGERLQFQRVEGWTTEQILGRMRAGGISDARITRDLLRA
jgi:hypothetical protein